LNTFRIIKQISCETQLERLYIPIPRCRNVIQNMNTDEMHGLDNECSVEVIEA